MIIWKFKGRCQQLIIRSQKNDPPEKKHCNIKSITCKKMDMIKSISQVGVRHN